MSNSIIRCFQNVLSQDTNANDLTGSALAAYKASIASKYSSGEYSIDPTLLNANYWAANRFHCQSLQTLLGDSSSDWFKNKLQPFNYQPDPELVPFISFQCTKEIESYAQLTTFEASLTIQITCSSSLDEALAENIGFRINKVLGDQAQMQDSIIVPNNIYKLNYRLDNISSQSASYDTLQMIYKAEVTFFEV